MRRVIFLAAVCLLIAGCEVEGTATQAVPEQSSSNVKSNTSTHPLPFENLFPNRWNSSNDGTPYEPCTSFSRDELARFEIDPTVIEDAAIVDGQGIRGCRWLMRGRFSLGQVVTNSSSIEVYKVGTPELAWKQNLEVDGRTIGVFGLNDHDATCSTYVQSQSAAVVTNVLISSEPEARATIDACKLVEEFTRAYIDKIPE
jgi:hypothetical protein